MKLYRDFETQDELDREYNTAIVIPEAAQVFARWQELAGNACSEAACELGVRYGPTRAEYVDIFPAGPGAPVHLFIHGGYWRRFSARDHAFVGPWLTRAGFTAVIVNYELCPRVTIDEIVRQVRAALAWTVQNIERWGGDPRQLTVSGHSAGGHLTAMILATDWEGTYGLPNSIVGGAVPLSGLFDLAPFPYTYLQPALQLTWGEVRRNSPVHLPPGVRVPTVVAVGGAETSEFRRQSKTYAQHLEGHGIEASYLELDGRNHLSALEAWSEPDGPLVGALRQVAGIGR
jgi:arylformamidase